MPADDTKSHERMLAAILAADVAGYSRLMADDELATVKALKEARSVFRDRIAAHSGRLIDTAGDSVLAEFKSVVEAVQCAVEVQETLSTDNQPVPEHRKMHFRIGINLGDIIEEDDGTIYGDGVNVAARLEGLAAPGGVMVSESAHMQVLDKLDLDLVDAGEHEVKNIARPVRAYRVLLDASESTTSAAIPSALSTLRRPKVVTGIAAALAVIIGLAVWGVTVNVEVPQMVTADGTPTDDPVLAVPTGPSIAVLPFANLSGEPEQDYFADGISEDVLNQISPAMGIQVISRGSSFRYRGSGVDPIKAGTELGAQFLVVGSVRRSGENIRVTAELVEVATGKKIWSNAYDRELNTAELFAVQDDITQSIVATIADEYGVISQLTRQRTRDSNASLGSYECVLRAYHYFEYFNESNHLIARDCLEEAVERDPEYAEAWGWLAILYANEHAWTFNLREDPLGRSLRAGNTAVGADRNSQMAWEGKAAAHFFRDEWEEFHPAAQRAISINPNDVSTLGNIAWYYGNFGKYDYSLPLMDKAISLSPFPPGFYFQPHWQKFFSDGDYEAALEYAIKFEYVGFFLSYLMLASTYVELGDENQASINIEKLLEAKPDIVETYRPWANSLHWPATLIDKIERALEKAGLFDEPEAPSRPVIAVLPFDNMSGDPEQEYFADGITEDIITRLAQYPDILVLGRNTTFQFKGQAVDIPTIAETLGADYIVEGSIRRGGDTVRVTAQLLGSEGGTHVWAKTFDRKLDAANIFIVQDAITEAIASRVGEAHGVIAKIEYERSSARSLDQLSDYECILRYYQHIRQYTPETHRVARDCLEPLVAANPDNSHLLSYLSEIYLEEIYIPFNPTDQSSLSRALALAEEAVRLDPRSSGAHAGLAFALLFADAPDRAGREAREAVRLSPNDSDVMTGLTLVLANIGEYELVEELIDRLVLINPNYPPRTNWNRAKLHLIRHEYEPALMWLERTSMDWWWGTQIWMASVHCSMGDVENGHRALDQAAELEPNWQTMYWQAAHFWHKGGGLYPLYDILGKGLEACGWDVPPDPGPEAFAPTQ